MGVSVDEAGGDQASTAVVVLDDGLQHLVRFLAVLSAPRDRLAIADERGVLDDAGRGPGKKPADVAETPHLETTVLPPTTTLMTSQAEWP